MKTTLLLPVLFFCNVVFSSCVNPVLFIGNSFTLVNNLPLVFERLATTKKVKSHTSAWGAATFNSHWNSISTRELLMSRNWTVVVLQEQSAFLADIPKNYIPRSIAYSAKLYDLASHYTTRVALFETWGYKNGNPTFQTGLDDTYDKMQVRLKTGYEATQTALLLQHKQNTSAFVVYAGETWRTAMKRFVLHKQDDMHPTPHGTYLAACMFYSTLFNESPVGKSYTIKGVSRKHARILQRIAWDTYKNLQQTCIRITTNCAGNAYK